MAELQKSGEIQARYYKLQNELAVEKARRENAEQLWMTQIDAAKTSSKEAQDRSAALECQLAERNVQIETMAH